MDERDELLEVHGDGNCHICGKPKIAAGSPDLQLPTCLDAY